jgi:hypothetical protein
MPVKSVDNHEMSTTILLHVYDLLWWFGDHPLCGCVLLFAALLIVWAIYLWCSPQIVELTRTEVWINLAVECELMDDGYAPVDGLVVEGPQMVWDDEDRAVNLPPIMLADGCNVALPLLGEDQRQMKTKRAFRNRGTFIASAISYVREKMCGLPSPSAENRRVAMRHIVTFCGEHTGLRAVDRKAVIEAVIKLVFIPTESDLEFAEIFADPIMRRRIHNAQLPSKQ